MLKLRPITKYMFLSIALLIFSAIFIWKKPENINSNSEYFSMITVKHPDSKAVYTTIRRSSYKKLCEIAVDASKTSLMNSCPECIINASCTDEIPAKFQDAFKNKRISLAYFAGDDHTRIFIEEVSVQESVDWCNSILEDMIGDFVKAECIEPFQLNKANSADAVLPPRKLTNICRKDF